MRNWYCRTRSRSRSFKSLTCWKHIIKRRFSWRIKIKIRRISSKKIWCWIRLKRFDKLWKIKNDWRSSFFWIISFFQWSHRCMRRSHKIIRINSSLTLSPSFICIKRYDVRLIIKKIRKCERIIIKKRRKNTQCIHLTHHRCVSIIRIIH